ncbi:hypothetical protein GQ600_19300 [Phytophthora cactorum]|nr:hypothetical protein GQ600_19300 [Phytophthora cactorum]
MVSWVEAREPLLKNVFEFVDAKNYRVRASMSISSVPSSLTIAYAPDKSLGVVSNSVFPCSSAMRGRILTPLKDGDIDRPLPSVRRPARMLHNAITSVRQAAECGYG